MSGGVVAGPERSILGPMVGTGTMNEGETVAVGVQSVQAKQAAVLLEVLQDILPALPHDRLKAGMSSLCSETVVICDSTCLVLTLLRPLTPNGQVLYCSKADASSG